MMRPPSTCWVPAAANRFACFLSHFKAESGSDARYLRDLLQRMLGPVFLDSSDLTDLRALFTDGVHRSDVLVLLATELLTRPWCILELWEAVSNDIPVVVAVRGRGWNVADACHLLDNLDTELPLRNPGALEEVQRHIDKPLAEVAAALRAAIEEATAEHHAVSWTPHGTDNQVLASALDLSDAMAAVAGRDLVWPPRRRAAPPLRLGSMSRMSASAAMTGSATMAGVTPILTLEESTVNLSQPWGALAEAPVATEPPPNGGRADGRSPPRRGLFSTLRGSSGRGCPLTRLARGERRRRRLRYPASDHYPGEYLPGGGDLAHRRALPAPCRLHRAPPRRRGLGRALPPRAGSTRALGVRCFLGGRDDGSDDGIRASAEGSRSRTLPCRRRACSRCPPSSSVYDAVTRETPFVCVRLISEDVDAYDFDDARDLLGPPPTSCRGASAPTPSPPSRRAPRGWGPTCRRWRRRSPPRCRSSSRASSTRRAPTTR